MTERTAERVWVEVVFGREEESNDLGRNAAATIYHSIFLHNTLSDNQLLDGIKKNLRKLISAEDLKRLDKEHQKLEEHML